MMSLVVTEANLVGDLKNGWWTLEHPVTFAPNRNLSKEFEEIPEGEQVFMGNSSVVQVRGRGKVGSKLFSGKNLLMSNMLYVISLRKNLISGALLTKVGIKLVFQSDIVVLTH